MSGCAVGLFQSIGAVIVAQLVVGASGTLALTAASNEHGAQVICCCRYFAGIAGRGGSFGAAAWAGTVTSNGVTRPRPTATTAAVRPLRRALGNTGISLLGWVRFPSP